MRTRAMPARGSRSPSSLRPIEKPCAPRAPVVLIAEDDDEFRGLIASELRKIGYWVLECRDGTELIRRVVACREDRTPPGIDLVISDVSLPGPSGLELLAMINQEHIGIPVILMSAFGDIHSFVQAMNHQAAAFFPKPVPLDRLLGTVRASIWKPT